MKVFLYNPTNSEIELAGKWASLSGKEVEIVTSVTDIQETDIVLTFGEVSAALLKDTEAHHIKLPALPSLANRIENTEIRKQTILTLRSLQTAIYFCKFQGDNIEISPEGNFSGEEIDRLKAIRETLKVNTIRFTKR